MIFVLGANKQHTWKTDHTLSVGLFIVGTQGDLARLFPWGIPDVETWVFFLGLVICQRRVYRFLPEEGKLDSTVPGTEWRKRAGSLATRLMNFWFILRFLVYYLFAQCPRFLVIQRESVLPFPLFYLFSFTFWTFVSSPFFSLTFILVSKCTWFTRSKSSGGVGFCKCYLAFLFIGSDGGKGCIF